MLLVTVPNREILNVYNKYLKGKNDKRWRIEHAQIVNQNDFNLFGSASIVPSVQPTHATSDMYWAGERLGTKRLKSGYALKQLLQQNGWLPLVQIFLWKILVRSKPSWQQFSERMQKVILPEVFKWRMLYQEKKRFVA
jgi:hypothetical protein